MLLDGLTSRLILLPVLAVVISIHEWAHAWVSFKFGDPTAKDLGRVTLNPLAHLDPLGTILLLLAGFGWGKPVPINPAYYKNPRRDQAIVALAGPLSNLVIAIFFAFIYRLGILESLGILEVLIQTLVILNVVLAIFNLLPINPLDGFKIVLGILPNNLVYDWLETAQWGMFLLVFLIITPFFDKIVFGPVTIIVNLLLGL